MTANLVTGLSPVQELKTNVSANVNPASGTDFSNVLKNSTSKEENAPQPKDNAVKSDKPEAKEASPVDKEAKSETKVKDDSDKPAKVKEESKGPAEDSKPISDEAMEEITEVAMTMVQTIAEVLEIPAEQVEEAISALDIEPAELLNSNTIPDLVVELTDATDKTDIMTDEELFADVKQLMTDADKLMNEVADTLQIPVEDLKSQIADAVADKDVNEAVDTDRPVDMLADAELTRKPEQRQSMREEVMVDNKPEDNEETAPVSARHEEKGRQGSGSENRGGEHLNFTQTVTDTLKGMVAEKVDAAYPTYTTSTEQIMEQVSESLRMTMNEDITEMEMQLHPASLGNVRVQVAAKDGVITASFTTENQQVKEVLEAQIIQLKDQMNEQGIKVEAVEVTVGAHAFERNLSDNGQSREGQPEAEAKRKKVRGINLGGGDISELDMEELDEEDKVTADMMARQGNTVDYMA